MCVFLKAESGYSDRVHLLHSGQVKRESVNKATPRALRKKRPDFGKIIYTIKSERKSGKNCYST
jgi:hypothetical protein